MATISKDLVLTFGKEDGKDYSLTVVDYKEGISDDAIKAGGQAIVTQGIFAPGGYALASLNGAKKVDKTVTDVEVTV